MKNTQNTFQEGLQPTQSNHTNQWIRKNQAVCKLVIIVGIVLINWLSLHAETPDADGARQFAGQFFQQAKPAKVKGQTGTSTVQSLQLKFHSKRTVQSPVFVYQNQADGFAVILQHQGKFALAGYAPAGQFDGADMPPQLKKLIRFYEDSLTIQPQAAPQIKFGNPVQTPLLVEAGIALNQFYHTNVGNSPTGCVATALAQIMLFHKHPATGKGSHCYEHPRYGTLCADFENTHYNWNNPTLEDLEKLSFHVGVAAEMYYGKDQWGSAPTNSNYYHILAQYFKYQQCLGISDAYYLQNEIDHRRPVYTELYGDPGHAIVIDGYDDAGLFHFNFGWGGNYNGYYVINTNSTFRAGYKFGTNLGTSFSISPISIKANVQDSLALIDLHNISEGKTKWNLSLPVNQWEDVRMMNDRVIKLDLGTHKVLAGEIPASIGNLTALRDLFIVGSFTGNLPASITNLTALRTLSIQAMDKEMFTGVIPENIDALTNLQELRLIGMRGTIPNAIGNLTHLKILDLKNGQLTGSIPQSISQLTQLTEINLWNNQLTGNIPDIFGNLSQLNTLNIIGNQLTGNLPESLGNCRQIYTLAIRENQLSGAVPAFIGNFKRLTSLDISKNKFTALPNEIGRLSVLQTLDLSDNLLEALPDSIMLLQNLIDFRAFNNQIATVPEGFGLYPLLRDFYFQNNKLTEFPEALCELSKLKTLSLSDNYIRKFPSLIAALPAKLEEFSLKNNQIHGIIPANLLNHPSLNYLNLSDNYFTYEDLPFSDEKFKFKVGEQKLVPLSKQLFKVGLGDTLRIDIRDISPFHVATNEYRWKAVKNNKIFENNPVLTVPIDKKNIDERYICTVTNPEAPVYTFMLTSTYGYDMPCLESVQTDTISLVAATEEELLAEQYPDSRILIAENLSQKEVNDGLVTLTRPAKVRGAIQWQASANGVDWYELSEQMTQNDLKVNLVGTSAKELVLAPKTSAYYRCAVQDINCEPLYSDTIQVNPFGDVLFDDIIPASETDITIAVDSIEITVPAKIFEENFRLTVVKLDNPPAFPEGTTGGAVYDVTASFGSTFEKPLLIKFNNIDPNLLSDAKQLMTVKPVYYDDAEQLWKIYEEGGIDIKDSTVVFYTHHLTKLSWTAFVHGSYTHIARGQHVDVIYKWGTETGEENNFLAYQYAHKEKKPWHTDETDPDTDSDGTPLMIQDMVHYMDEIVKTFKAKGFKTPDLKFNVYASNLGYDGAFGQINAFGYMAGRGYFKINTALATSRDELRSTLAHEYMHYTQDYYMGVLVSNMFFAEVHAPLADRLVWPDADDLKIAESEQNLSMVLTPNNQGLKTIFDLLGQPWDKASSVPVFEKFLVNTADANVSSTFLHYMRSYREGDKKLDIVKLLTNHTWKSNLSNWTWRAYINEQIGSQLNSTIGDEYDDYVRFLLSGKEPKMSVLSKDGNSPFTHLIKNTTPENDGTFTQRLVYNFKSNTTNPQIDTIDIQAPYLSSKILMLYNQTPNKLIVVNYKRLHDADDNYKVYYGKYDFTDKTIKFTDISELSSYNMYVEGRNAESLTESQNIAFLLFVNKKCPNIISMDNTFDAHFQLTAYPVPDIEKLMTANIMGGTSDMFIHTYSNNNKSAFIISGDLIDARNAPNVVDHQVNYYTRHRHLLNDSVYVFNISSSRKTRMEYPDDGPGLITLPVIQHISKTTTIEYGFKSGELSIHCVTHTLNETETIHEEDPRIVKISEWDYDQSLHLHNIDNWIFGNGLLQCKTTNSDATQAIIKSLSSTQRSKNYDINTGALMKDETIHYLSTDYGRDDVELNVLLEVRE